MTDKTGIITVQVPYRQADIAVQVARSRIAGIIEPNDVPSADDPVGAVAQALKHPAGGPQACDYATFMAQPGTLLVIVNDGTRPTPTKTVLQAIGADLEACQAEFIIATGVHRGPTPEEYRFIFGDFYEVFKDRIHVHDARQSEQMRYLGTTSGGTRLLLNRRVVEAGKLLVIGSVEPHYFAGYTGGRKAFLPGTAAYESIEHNHRLALSQAARALALQGNPVHEDMMEAMQALTIPTYTIMTVLDKHQHIHSVYSGGLSAAFDAAIAAADAIFVADIEHKADVVVAVSRYPMDVDLYQAQKAIDNGKLALKEGGTLILVASCREGVGEQAFITLLSSCDTAQAVMESIAAGYKLGYHKAAKMAEVFQWATVEALTDLDDALLESIFIHPVHDLQLALDAALDRHGPDSRVLFLLDGSVTVPRVTPEKIE